MFIRKYFVLSVYILVLAACFCVSSPRASEEITSTNPLSISHFRAFSPPALSFNVDTTFINKIAQDRLGYLWLGSERNLIMRYDGYQLKRYQLPSIGDTEVFATLDIYRDKKGRLWFANNALHYYQETTDSFETYDLSEQNSIYTITSDNEDNLWLAGDKFGLINFDTETNTVIQKLNKDDISNLPEKIAAMRWDSATETLWMSSPDGFFKYDSRQNTFAKINTPLDTLLNGFFARDISLDTLQRKLWVATEHGLLQIDIDTQVSKLYLPDQTRFSLSDKHLTTTKLDSKGRLWIGTEKKGLCLYLTELDGFTCVEASDNAENSIPMSTIEDIYEDSQGNLWLAMNNSGFIRVSPELEKFASINSRISNKEGEYFKRSFTGLSFENGELWIATDGGGIQIVDQNKNTLEFIKRDETQANSLPSDAVVTMKKDVLGRVWTGTWGGGLSVIDPQTREVKNYMHDSNNKRTNQIASPNVVEVIPDRDLGVWIAVWYEGLQYLDLATEQFTNFTQSSNNYPLINVDVTDARADGEYIWLVGSKGLERFSTVNHTSELIFPIEDCMCEAIYINSERQVLIGAQLGFYVYDIAKNDAKFIDLQLESDASTVYSFYQINNEQIWIGTNLGVLEYDIKSGVSRLFNEDNGLVSNATTRFGDIFEVNDELYFPSRGGVSIVKPDDLPTRRYQVSTVLHAVKSLGRNVTEQRVGKYFLEAPIYSIIDTPTSESELVEIPFQHNSLIFSFSSNNLVFPHRTTFKYRLLGLSDEFLYTGSLDSSARFTNLSAGKYSFEVYAQDSDGNWDERGVTFSFLILAPWYQSWWAWLLYSVCLLLLVVGIVKWRTRTAERRNNELFLLVEQKTSEIREFAKELQQTSEELANLNSQLESRVEQRTAELQLEINERKVAESKLYHLAFHDQLTEMPNRAWLSKKLEELLQGHRGQKYGLLVLDGDRFKAINDTHGHVIGDELIKSCGLRLNSLLNTEQYACRLGGDEFAVVVENVESLKALETLANDLIEAFKRPFELNTLKIHFNMSIGVVLFDQRYNNVTNIIRDADIAMYQAKDAGKSTYKIYTSQMHEDALTLFEIEAELRQAIKDESFHLVYQPILDLNTNIVVGFEALIRWHHPERGFISPELFIPISEDTGLIVEIGEWVLNEACTTFRSWQLFKPSDNMTISVNLSSVQLQSDNFIDVLDAALAKASLDGSCLKLELTETSLIENTKKVAEVLEQIRKRKVELSIDDFGTGYSSLSYLKQLPVQHIKIDRKFVDAIDNTPDGSVDRESLEIVKAAITLGQSLNMKVTAEGIETITELNALKKLGCDYAQGYLIDKPLSASDAEERINRVFSLK